MVVLWVLLSLTFASMAAATAIEDSRPDVEATRVDFLNVSISAKNPRLSIAPAISELSTDPAGHTSMSVALTNSTKNEISLKLSTRNLQAARSADAFVEPTTDPIGGAKWVSLPVKSLTIPPGRQARLTVLVAPPSNTPPGSYAISITAAQKFSANESASRVAATTLLNSVLVVNISGDAVTKLSLGRASTHRVRFHGDNTSFGAQLSNTGTTFVLAKPTIRIPAFLATARQSIEGTPTPILPNGKRNIRVQWKELPWLGWVKPKLTIRSHGTSTTLQYPSMLILPPVWFDIALVLAVSVPISVVVRRRKRARHR